MDVLLHHYVTSASERRVLSPNYGCVDLLVSNGTFGAIDKPGQVSIVEVPKAVCLVDGGDQTAEARGRPESREQSALQARISRKV
jgi:hypothetical protein